MSDPTLSDIDFKNKMVLVGTTLKNLDFSMTMTKKSGELLTIFCIGAEGISNESLWRRSTHVIHNLAKMKHFSQK